MEVATPLHTRRTLSIMIVTCAVALAVAEAEPELIIEVGNTTALPGQTVPVEVYLSNYTDEVAAFNFWVQLDRTDILTFTTTPALRYDTSWWVCTNEYQGVCYDSAPVPPSQQWDFYHIDTVTIGTGKLDTDSTLVSGWEYVEARSLGGLGTELNVVGFAQVHDSVRTEGIPTQEGGLLMKLIANVRLIPDTMSDRTVNIRFLSEMQQHFNFSDPDGEPLGLSCDSVPDTSYWRCMFGWWSCYRVSHSPYDSISIDTVWWCRTDTGAVHALAGSVTILDETIYGDTDCNGAVDIADLVFFVDYMFRDGPPPPCPKNLDCDTDYVITVTDLICLIEWMFPRHSTGSPRLGGVGSSTAGPILWWGNSRLTKTDIHVYFV